MKKELLQLVTIALLLLAYNATAQNLAPVRLQAQDLKKVNMASSQYAYIDVPVADRVIEANETLTIPCNLAGSAGEPLGCWIGQIISGTSYSEMAFSISGVNRDGFILKIHNTTEKTPNYNGPGHGERSLNNLRIRVFVIYSL